MVCSSSPSGAGPACACRRQTLNPNPKRFVQMHPEQLLPAAGRGAVLKDQDWRPALPQMQGAWPVDRDHGRDLVEPDLLELLARDLPPPLAVEGPLVPIETVMNVVMLYRNTPEAVHFVCTELDAGRVPDGIAGPSEGVPVPQILAMTPEGRKLLGEMSTLPPAPGGGAFPPHPMRPPHPSMIHEPPLPAPFMGSYGDMEPVPFEEMPPHPAFHAGPPVLPPRKRARWEEGREAYAGYEADVGLPYSYTTPHPSQWHNDERPRKTHPAVARAASRAAGRGRPRGEDV
ncbi:hypothetical protein DUNSADRAFT_16502 [Dunaliella salina]|uniref:Uncharacterized protein n=1 Tax=Dunaliella salina TaxID=3046 RepID=A0ABQ7G3K1_DUNSA|nr:hypothetical protein DUNSADRAFT_16502 [Dunaliella salina]|eukprot:KAF5829142.1 hypothetical protein DUNSADRAFT_16502 [Dunaliella salina]